MANRVRRIDHDRVRELSRKGLTAVQIAQRVGCTASAVRRILREER